MTARRGIIPVFIPHLGCPHDCAFCNQKRISGALSPATAGDVAREIEQGLTRCRRPAQLAFYGGSFTAIPVSEQLALLGAAQPYLRSGELESIRLSTRPDAIDGPTLERLRARGVSVIELGAQSMDDEVLQKSGRGHSAEDTVRASRLIRRAGFSLVLQMMTGLPGSDARRDIETARRVIALSPDAARIYPTVIIRGTPLYGLWREGKYTGHTVEAAVEVCAQILPLFESAGIPVIRLGLNPTDELSGGSAAGGAYHPALGELVKSRVLLNRARGLLRRSPPPRSVTLAVSPRCLSQMAGQHRRNIEALRAEFGLDRVKIIPAPGLPPGEIKIIEE
ncbi:MAG: radical SAM protein [Butyricicoccus sp.]|nr:radical SAM protein [Butyricicoccus sp.]